MIFLRTLYQIRSKGSYNMIHSSRRLRPASDEPAFIFCHWLQAALSAAFLAAGWIIRSDHPEWIAFFMQLIASKTLQLTDLFQLFQNIP